MKNGLKKCHCFYSGIKLTYLFVLNLTRKVIQNDSVFLDNYCEIKKYRIKKCKSGFHIVQITLKVSVSDIL